MRDTHYIIFCHPKKQLIIGGGGVATQWKLLTEDYVMSVAHIMDIIATLSNDGGRLALTVKLNPGPAATLHLGV